MRLELAQAWRETGQMLRAHADMVSALAGMFILMPGILLGWFLPDPQPLPADATPWQRIAVQADWFSANAPAILLNGLCVAFGSMAILILLLDRRRPTVAEAMRAAIRALPIYLLANFLQSLAVLVGLLALILPGLYLAARFLCMAPVAAVEGLGNPVAVLGRSIDLTHGNGWRILLLLTAIMFVAVILSTALVTTTGIVGALLLPADLLRLVVIIVKTLVETGVAVVILGISATIYRQALAER